MAAPGPHADEHDALIKAFSGLGGLGVDESSLVAATVKWHKEPENREGLRKRFTSFFKDHGSFQRCEDDYIRYLKAEFARFKNIMVLWAMHPWERDARWVHHVLHKAHPFAIIVEIACTRSSEELLGARKAYQALFHHSIEEDVAYHVKENYSNRFYTSTVPLLIVLLLLVCSGSCAGRYSYVGRSSSETEEKKRRWRQLLEESKWVSVHDLPPFIITAASLLM